MNRTIINLLENALQSRQLQVLFQPISKLDDWSIMAFQAWTRIGKEAELFSPQRLLHLAAATGDVERLNRLILRSSLTRYAGCQRREPLFVCVAPIVDAGLGDELARFAALGLPSTQLVVEVSNPKGRVAPAQLQEVTDFYRSYGLRVAQGVSASESALPYTWSRLGADYLKLERSLIRRLPESTQAQSRLRSLLEMCSEEGIGLVAEGIKDHLEYDTLLRLGVPLGQGTFISRPARDPVEALLAPRLFCRQDLKRLGDAGQQTLGSLLSRSDFVADGDSIAAALQHCTQDHTGQPLPLLDAQHTVLGLVYPMSLMAYAAQQPAADLQQPASLLAQPVSCQCEATLSVRDFALAVQRGELPLDGPVVVVDAQQHYQGLVQPCDLLRVMAENQQQHQRYANPLSGLPGSVVADEHIIGLLKSKSMFVAAEIGINEIKPYNDSYGYLEGDRVILQIAQLLRELTDPEVDFLAHTSGATFMVVFKSEDWFERCESMINQVDLIAPRFYRSEHQRAGGLRTADRRGTESFSPFLSMAVGAVPVYPGKFYSHHEIFSAASEVHERAQATSGGAIYVDQRHYRSAMGDLCVRLS